MALETLDIQPFRMERAIGDSSLWFRVLKDGYLVQANAANLTRDGLKTTLQKLINYEGSSPINKNLWSGIQVADFGCSWTGRVPVKAGDIIRWYFEDTPAATDNLQGWITIEVSE